ncbi:MAG: hypothetical protein JXR83_18000, partial [Deltaproteobacteria bacterium]|nr:hypothetical protein [Deltaproteobacteria bacterium]
LLTIAVLALLPAPLPGQTIAADAATFPASQTATAPASATSVPTDLRPPATAEEELARVRNLFAYGDCPAATDMLSELVLPGRLVKEADLIDAHRMLGTCFFQLENRGEARREFMALLYLAPDTRLDPFLTPPAVVDFFDAIRSEIADKLEEVRAKRERERGVRKPQPMVTLAERTVRRHNWYGTLMPLGYPQFERGAWGWGALFATAQLAGAITAAASFWGSQALLRDGRIRVEYDAAGNLVQDGRGLYQTLRIANWSAAALTAVAYAAGVTEAIISFREETPVGETVRQVPLDQLPAAQPRSKE